VLNEAFIFEVLRVEAPEPSGALTRGRMLALNPLPRMMIGRALTAGLHLDHPSVSREHAWLTQHGGALWLEVATSKSSTFVDGQRVNPGEEVVLAPGARVQLGAVLLGLHVQAETIPFRDAVTTDEPASLLEVTVDGPARVIRFGGQLVTLTPRASLFIATLATRPGEPIARWDLVDALEGARGLPQLATEVRKAVQQLITHGRLDAELLRAAMVRGAPESQRGELLKVGSEGLAAALIVARRGHGYWLSLPSDLVRVRDAK